MQERRVMDRRKQLPVRKVPILPFMIMAAIVGAALGFFAAAYFDFGSVRIKESPFGDTGKRIARGRDFDGLGDWGRLSDADRERFRRAADAVGKVVTATAGDSGHAPRAVSEAEALLKEHPSCLTQGLASLARMDGSAAFDTAAAAEPWRACLASDPDQPWANYVAGRYFEKARLPDSAATHYLRAIKSSPQFAYAYAGLGRLHLQEGEFRTAHLNLRIAIGLMESNPDDYRPGKKSALPVTEMIPYDLLATLYYRIGAEDSARMALEYGQEKGLATDQMALVQGWLWESRGFLSKADSLYKKLRDKDPGNAAYEEAIATLGYKPQARGGSDSGARSADGEAIFAISLLDPLARQHPHDAPLWMALGQAYYRRGLYGMATECFDSSLRYDASLPGLSEKRDAAYQALIRENPGPTAAAAMHSSKAGLSVDEQVPVIIPGTIALLGTYSVPWGSTQTQVRQAYPKKDFRTLPNGNLLDSFIDDGVRHEYLLAFKAGHLWGVRVYVTDSAGVSGDLFGRIIRIKSKISGEGRGTGESKCAGAREFTGAIWENDDTFEFMAQFQGEDHRVRLARIGRDYLPPNKRLCDLVAYLKDEAWR